MLSGMAGHVFISYSQDDAGYVQRLAAQLQEAGIPVSLDRNIGSRTGWSFEIEDRLRTSAAVVPVVSDMSSRSQWVDREIDFAQELGTPILPIYLGGTMPLRLRSYQHEDGTGGRIPSAEFVHRLADLSAATPAAPPTPPGLPAPAWVTLDDGERVFLVARGRLAHRWPFLVLVFPVLGLLDRPGASVTDVLPEFGLVVLGLAAVAASGMVWPGRVPVCVTDRRVLIRHIRYFPTAVTTNRLRDCRPVTLSDLDPTTGTARITFQHGSGGRKSIVFDVPQAARFVELMQRMIDADLARTR
jgi:hypothetical protein